MRRVLVILGLMWFSGQAQLDEPFKVLDRIQIVYASPRMTNPLVRLSVNGHPPMLFLLDSSTHVSGTNIPIVIDAKIAKQLGIFRTGVVSLESAHFINDQGQLSQNKHVFPQVAVASMPLGHTYSGEPIAGIITAGFFATTPIKLDFRHHRMELLYATTDQLLSRLKETYITVKLNRLESKGYVHALPVVLPSGRQVAMTLATGSAFSWLAEKDVQGVDLAEICSFPRQSLTFGTSSRGFLAARDIVTRLDWMSIGSIKIENVWLALESERGKSYSVMGMDILSCFDEVILDYNSGYLFIKKPSGKLSGRLEGVSGLKIGKDSAGQAVVQEVEPGTAGSRAGFQRGDRILAVGDRRVDKLSIEWIQTLIDGYAGIPQKVKIFRDGMEQEVSLTPDSRCTALGEAGSEQSDFSVLLVERGSEVFFLVTRASERAKQIGLRVGDRIVIVNGYSVSEHREKLLKLFRTAGELEVHVKRPAQESEIILRIPLQGAQP